MWTERWSSRRSAFLAFCLSFVSALVALSYAAPASAFLATSLPLSLQSAPVRSAKGKTTGSSALFAIKRKVKVDQEENYSGKVVESGPMTGMMMGSDNNALFDVIEKNKQKAAEAAAAAQFAQDALSGGGDKGEGDEEEVDENAPAGGSDEA